MSCSKAGVLSRLSLRNLLAFEYSGECIGFQIQRVKPCTSCVTLTFPAFSFPMVEWSTSPILTGFLCRLNEKMYIKCPAQYLAYWAYRWHNSGWREDTGEEKQGKDNTLLLLMKEVFPPNHWRRLKSCPFYSGTPNCNLEPTNSVSYAQSPLDLPTFPIILFTPLYHLCVLVHLLHRLEVLGEEGSGRINTLGFSMPPTMGT